MGRQHDAHALHAEVGHDGSNGQSALGIDAGGRFIEEGDLGPTDERQGEREPLLLAAGEMAPRRGGHRGQANQIEQR